MFVYLKNPIILTGSGPAGIAHPELRRNKAVRRHHTLFSDEAQCTFAVMWMLKQAWSYLIFQWSARRPRQMHSPYLFTLLRAIHDRTKVYYVFDAIEHLRTQLMQSDELIPGIDYGAGSRQKNTQTVKQIAKTALSSATRCQMMFRLLTSEKPQTILELGTSLGIMSAYLAGANSDSHVSTIEGNPSLSAIAEQIARTLQLRNIHFHTGRFSDILPDLFTTIPAFDFVLIDGDHRGESLKSYFQTIKPRLSQNAIVVIDDIRWSEDMFEAWKDIIQDDAVTCSLDYFKFGLLFFRKDFLEKAHFQITV